MPATQLLYTIPSFLGSCFCPGLARLGTYACGIDMSLTLSLGRDIPPLQTAWRT